MKTLIKWEVVYGFTPRIVTGQPLRRIKVGGLQTQSKSSNQEKEHMKSALLVCIAILIIFTSGCGRRSAVGFHLPDGNVEKGKAAFVELKCYSCHKVDGVETPAPIVVKHPPVVIGGQVAHVKTYGELVTSIIDPSHRIAANVKKDWEVDCKMSPMPNFDRLMTVEQMTDIVSFLQSRYVQLAPLNTYVY